MNSESRHPGGYAVVPIAMLRDGHLTVADRAVYAAIASAVNFDTWSGRVRQARIADRSGLRDRRAIVGSIRRLTMAGYLTVDDQRGGARVFTLLPTESIRELEAERRADAEAADPAVTGAIGGHSKAPCVSRGEPSQGPSLPTPKTPCVGRTRPPASDVGTPQESFQNSPVVLLPESWKTVPASFQRTAWRRLRELADEHDATSEELTKVAGRLLELLVSGQSKPARKVAAEVLEEVRATERTVATVTCEYCGAQTTPTLVDGESRELCYSHLETIDEERWRAGKRMEAVR